MEHRNPQKRGCPQCGAPNPERNKFCGTCGSLLVATADEVNAAETTDESLGQARNQGRGFSSDAGSDCIDKGVIIAERYEIQAELAVGAMGRIYRAWDGLIGRDVAIKMLRLDRGKRTAKETTERFYREAHAAGKLAHPSIVTCFDVGRFRNTHYLVLEYIRGRTLSDVLEDRGKPFPFAEACEIIAPILSALEHAHARGIIHRDIKPANLMISTDGEVKITDFGIAKHLAADTLTQDGVVLGTPYYMAPEQVRAEPLDGRADIFGVGCVFYELITGVKPFPGRTISSVIYKILHLAPVLPTRLNPSLPATADDIVLRAVAKQKEDRYAAAGDFRTAVLAAIGKEAGGSTANPPERPPDQGERTQAFTKETMPSIRRPSAEEIEAILLGAAPGAGARPSEHRQGSTAPPPDDDSSTRRASASDATGAGLLPALSPAGAHQQLRPETRMEPGGNERRDRMIVVEPEAASIWAAPVPRWLAFTLGVLALLSVSTAIVVGLHQRQVAMSKRRAPARFAAVAPAATPASPLATPGSGAAAGTADGGATPVETAGRDAPPQPLAGNQAAIAAGSLAVEVHPAGIVTVDGHKVGRAEPTLVISLAPGFYQVKVAIPGFADVSRTVTIEAGKVTPFTHEFDPVGRLMVTSRPAGELWIDGKRKGELNTRWSFFLTPGPHQVTVKRRFRSEEKTVEVEAYKTVKAEFALARLRAGS
ncbi:MAG: protein kinase [Candidatus Schekmanbacteria bacterium]|nr:protein kinase [Candidatus Schekmanbacteria bacterium]